MYKNILNKKFRKAHFQSLSAFPQNRKAAIGETITWFAATIIIIGALIIFLLLSSLVAKIKVLNSEEVVSNVGEESPVLVVKTLIAHDIADDRNKEVIDNTLEEWNNEK
jgi:hypothetical protein